MTLTDYKRMARAIAKEDSKAGFQFHISRNPYSRNIENLTGTMAQEGWNNRDRNEVEAEWEAALYAR